MRIAFLSVVLHGCGLSCTQMRSPSVAEIGIEGDQPPGLYELEVQGSGETEMCVLVLPSAEGDVVSCTDYASVVLAEDGGRVEALVLTEFAPGSFVVEVLRDGELVAEASFVPDYEVDEPNGKGCGERSQATLSMTL